MGSAREFESWQFVLVVLMERFNKSSKAGELFTDWTRGQI